jgi:hypothetical protein
MWYRMGLGMIAGLITSIALETTILRFRERFTSSPVWHLPPACAILPGT